MGIEIKCACGYVGRYQNIRAGQIIFTCGTNGCLAQSSNTDFRDRPRESQQEYFGRNTK